MYSVLSKVKEALVRAERSRPGSHPKVIKLALVCKRGRHRSVATSSVVEYIMGRIGYTDVTVIHHGDGSNICSLCGDCTSGADAIKRKQVAFRKAFALWESL